MANLINVGTVANDGTGDTIRQGAITTNAFISDAIIRVKTASDFGTIDSTKVYVIDGVVDMGSTIIEVPAGGINITGYTFDASKLISSVASHKMFVSAVGGSGNVLFTNIGIEVTGASAKVFDLVDVTGFNACEFNLVNFNNCTSLGVIDGYRQGLESGTGRFGGTPELELKGTWIGCYSITTSIVRSLTDGAYCLYKAGAGFTMASRFKSDANIDLNTTVGFFDFAPANFMNSNTLQLSDCIITRNGVSNPTDTTITPNISHTDIASVWRNNRGIENTFIGGEFTITTEVATTISTAGVFVDLAGTYTADDLQHFDHSVNGQGKHLGSGARNYNVFVDMILDSNSGNEIDLKAVVWDNSASAFVDYKTTRRVVNNLQGGRDVAFFDITTRVVLDKDDYLKFQVANVGATNNITAELGSDFIIEER